MKPSNITKTEIKKGNLGYYFLIYFNNSKYATVISASYNEKREVLFALKKFKDIGKLDTYGTCDNIKE